MKAKFNKLYNIYGRFLDILENLINFIMCTAILTMITCVLISILLRNAKASIPWLSELAQFSCVWSIYIGLGLAIKKRMLAGLDILTLVLKDKWSKVLRIVQDILMIGFLIAFIVTSKPLIDLLISSGRLSSGMQIPMFYAYLGPLVGSIFALLYAIDLLIIDITKKEVYEGIPNVESKLDEELINDILA